MSTTTILLSAIIGGILGAFMGWPRSPGFLRFVMTPFLALNAIPFFLLGLVLVHVFAFRFRWFPLAYGYGPGAFPEWSGDFATNVLYHAILPGLSIILLSIGGWKLGMRAMMVATHGVDYVAYADAKGLVGSIIFLRYLIRPSLLPRATALALGQILSGAVIVEGIFSYPGIGNVLYDAIRVSDFFLVQGIVFILIFSIGVATLILDLVYPLLDPRITYQRS